MQETRETALNDVRAALDRLVEADAVLASRLAIAMDRACEILALEPPDEVPERCEEALAKVPRELAHFARCLPIAVEGGTVVVLAAEPIDVLALRKLEGAVGPVRVVGAPSEAVWLGLNEAYGSAAELPALKTKPSKKKKAPEVEVAPTAEPDISELMATQEAKAISPETPKATESETASPADIVAIFTAPAEAAAPDDDEDAAVSPHEVAALLAAQEAAISEPAPEVVVEDPVLGSDEIAALLNEAEASAQPVQSEATPLEDQFAELMAEVQAKSPGAETPDDITAPRAQNLDLLSAFQGAEVAVPLSEPPKPSPAREPVQVLELEKLSDSGAESDPESLAQQLERLNKLLNDEDAEPALDPNLAEKVPLEVAMSAMCAPLGIDGEDLVCLILDPPDMEGAERVAVAADMSLRLQLGGREEVLSALQRTYGEFQENEFLTALANREPAKEGLFSKLKGKLKRSA